MVWPSHCSMSTFGIPPQILSVWRFHHLWNWSWQRNSCDGHSRIPSRRVSRGLWSHPIQYYWNQWEYGEVTKGKASPCSSMCEYCSSEHFSLERPRTCSVFLCGDGGHCEQPSTFVSLIKINYTVQGQLCAWSCTLRPSNSGTISGANIYRRGGRIFHLL